MNQTHRAPQPSPKSFYEVLDVPRDATLKDIEQAYIRIKAYLSNDGLAAYSVTSDQDLGSFGAQIEEAYVVLSDPIARASYDAQQGKQHPSQPMAGASHASGGSQSVYSDPATAASPQSAVTDMVASLALEVAGIGPAPIPTTPVEASPTLTAQGQPSHHPMPLADVVDAPRIAAELASAPPVPESLGTDNVHTGAPPWQSQTPPEPHAGHHAPPAEPSPATSLGALSRDTSKIGRLVMRAHATHARQMLHGAACFHAHAQPSEAGPLPPAHANDGTEPALARLGVRSDSDQASHKNTKGTHSEAGTHPAALRRPTRSASTLRQSLQNAAIDLGEHTEFTGPVLRSIRESCAVSLDEVAEITKISRRYLRALESNDHQALPAPAYVRGFVQEYSRIFGLQATEVAKSYLDQLQRLQRKG